MEKIFINIIGLRGCAKQINNLKKLWIHNVNFQYLRFIENL